MNTLLSTAGRLTLMCAAAGFLISLTYIALAPAISESSEAPVAEAVASLSGTAVPGTFVPVADGPGITGYYPLEGESGGPAGYILLLRGSGFSGPVTVAAAFTPSGEITGIRLLRSESGPPSLPGRPLTRILAIFAGTGASRAVPASIDALPPSEAQAVSGATVSFVTLSRLFTLGADFVRSRGGEQ
ncbi:FMN-binding protein [Salinispira pacifica]